MATWKTLKRKYRWPLPCLWILAKQSMPTGVGSEFYTLRQNTDQHYMSAFPKKTSLCSKLWMTCSSSWWPCMYSMGKEPINISAHFPNISEVYFHFYLGLGFVWVFWVLGAWSRGGVFWWFCFLFFFTVTDNSYFHWGLRQSFQLVNKKLHKQKKS